MSKNHNTFIRIYKESFYGGYALHKKCRKLNLLQFGSVQDAINFGSNYRPQELGVLRVSNLNERKKC